MRAGEVEYETMRNEELRMLCCRPRPDREVRGLAQRRLHLEYAWCYQCARRDRLLAKQHIGGTEGTFELTAGDVARIRELAILDTEVEIAWAEHELFQLATIEQEVNAAYQTLPATIESVAV